MPRYIACARFVGHRNARRALTLAPQQVKAMAKPWETLVRESDFVCPITQSIMRDPVYDPESNNYERHAIVHWLRTQEKKGETTSSPLTRNELREHWLQTNRDLRSRLAEWLIRHADDYDEARQVLKEFCTVLPPRLYLVDVSQWYEGFMAKTAAAPDDASAEECFEIACYCAQGHNQPPFLNGSAPGWFERGAKLGHPEAQLQWAIHLHNERNDDEADEWTVRVVPDWEDGEDEEDGEPWISHFWAEHGKLRKMSDTAIVALALRLFIRRDSMCRRQFLFFMDGLCSAIHAATTSRDSQQVPLGAKKNRCRLFRHMSLSIQAIHRAECQTQMVRRELHAATMKLYSLYARDQSALHIGSMHQSMIDLGHFVEVTSELTDSVSTQSRVMMFELTDAVFQLYGGLYGDPDSSWFDKHCRIDCREWESLSSLRRCQLLFWFAQALTDWRHLPSERTRSMRLFESFDYLCTAAMGYDETCHGPANPIEFERNPASHESIGVLYGLKRNDFRVCGGLGLARAQFSLGSDDCSRSTIEDRIWAMSLVVCGDSCDEPTHQQRQAACEFIGRWLLKLRCPGPGEQLLDTDSFSNLLDMFGVYTEDEMQTQYAFAQCFHHGYGGVPVDLDKARRWYLAAARSVERRIPRRFSRQVLAQACRQLSFFWDHGVGGCDRNSGKAEFWKKKAEAYACFTERDFVEFKATTLDAAFEKVEGKAFDKQDKDPFPGIDNPRYECRSLARYFEERGREYSKARDLAKKFYMRAASIMCSTSMKKLEHLIESPSEWRQLSEWYDKNNEPEGARRCCEKLARMGDQYGKDWLKADATRARRERREARERKRPRQ